MIRRAIERGVGVDRLARAFNVNLNSINRRANLLDGIAPQAIALLQDQQFTPDVTPRWSAACSNRSVRPHPWDRTQTQETMR